MGNTNTAGRKQARTTVHPHVCVGNTHTNRPKFPPGAVHPHVCGEHDIVPNVARAQKGSSPRLWGTRGLAVETRRSKGFIPTSVGNTTKQPSHRFNHSVHPHVCGEHTWAKLRKHSVRSGSSPRLWGTPSIQYARGRFERFIPTSVGNTQCARRRTGTERGSSPRLWGTRGRNKELIPLRRFIPTSVGNTHCEVPACPADTVHPHVCGEHRLVIFSKASIFGSSPRLWGTLLSDGQSLDK